MSRCLTAKLYFANDKRECKHTKERDTYVVGAWSMAQTMYRTCNDGGQFTTDIVWQADA